MLLYCFIQFRASASFWWIFNFINLTGTLTNTWKNAIFHREVFGYFIASSKLHYTRVLAVYKALGAYNIGQRNIISSYDKVLCVHGKWKLYIIVCYWKKFSWTVNIKSGWVRVWRTTILTKVRTLNFDPVYIYEWISFALRDWQPMYRRARGKSKTLYRCRLYPSVKLFISIQHNIKL